MPLVEWMSVLDVTTRARIRARIDRIEDGNFGDVKALGGGLFELRLDFGPGYRIYFGKAGDEIHLVRGGDKSSQSSDIAQARKFWSGHD